MNPQLSRLPLIAAFLATAITGAGQSAPPPPPASDLRPDSRSEQDVILLSPFTVDTSQDSGYYASSTLAGSRIKTDLKDVAASVSVLTSEFMDDLGVNDIAGAMAFVSGAENDSTTHQEGIAALGSANGYVGGDFGDNNTRSGEIRVRGLGRASTTVNFIEIVGTTDRYNTERAEFLRGANSILFGLAEPAGLVNLSTKVANPRRTFSSLTAKVDAFGSSRYVMDHNQMLVRGKLALRGVGLYNDQRYEVDTAFQRDRRGFVTGTYQPFKGTTVRAYYEGVSSFGRRPNFRTVQDNVSEWLSAYNRYAPQMTSAQVAQAFYWDPTVPNADGLAPATTFTLSNGTAVNLGLIRRPLDTNPLGTVLIYSGDGNWSQPLGNVVTLLGNRTIAGAAVTPINTRSQFARSGAARENNPSFRADPQVTDTGIFPYETVEIGALPGNYRRDHGRRMNVSLDQRITDDLYLSATFQRETRDTDQYFAVLTQTNQISIDINQKLPDGRVNPNFLRPFIYGRNIGEFGDATVTNQLVQANYDFDFAEKLPRWKWLGSHRLTGVFTSTKQDRFSARWMNQFETDLPNVLPQAATGNNASGQLSRWPMQIWYVGDAVQVGDAALRFTGFPDTLAAHPGRSYSYLYYNNLANPRAWQTAAQQLRVGRGLVPNDAARTWTIQRNRGIGTSLQSFFWNNRVVTLVGWRRDTVESFLGVLRPRTEYPFPALPGTGRADFLPDGNTFRNEADTTTQSLVFKINDRLRIFANRSENFAATNPRQDNLFRQIAPQSGTTDEVGFGASLLGGRLEARLTRFESRQEGATSNTGVAGLRIAAFERSLYDALAAAGRLGEWQTIGVDGGISTQPYDVPNNAASTQDVVSEGYSLEVFFRPTPRWNFVASVDQLENVTSNIGREIGDFLGARAAYYRKYFAQGLRVDGTTTSTANLLQSQFVSTIASNYVNEILGEGVSNRGISPYTAKLVGRYSFIEGRLKGLAVGASLRWESGKIIGYGETTKVFNFGGLDNYQGRASDLSREYTSDSILAGGMMLTYSRRIFDGRVRWRVQFNAQNLFDDTGLRVIAANGDGSPVWAVSPPRSYELSNTFEF